MFQSTHGLIQFTARLAGDTAPCRKALPAHDVYECLERPSGAIPPKISAVIRVGFAVVASMWLRHGTNHTPATIAKSRVRTKLMAPLTTLRGTFLNSILGFAPRKKTTSQKWLVTLFFVH